MNAPANVRTNLPVLIGELPSGEAASPHNRFTRERQVVFLEALAESGSVRAAARRAGVSHQTVYRAKRACRALRKCVDAALLCARDHAEEALRCRAVDGVEEEVLYHGEVVATRTRYCSRLLLAHLGRLDRLAEREEVSALAEGFDAALAAFGAGDDTLGGDTLGEEVPVHRDVGDQASEGPSRDTLETGPDNPSPEPCHTRSTPPLDPAIDPALAHLAEPAFWRNQMAREPAFYGARWFERLHAMLAARPADAPSFEWLAQAAYGQPGREDLQDGVLTQVLGYEHGDEEWWRIDPKGRWHFPGECGEYGEYGEYGEDEGAGEGEEGKAGEAADREGEGADACAPDWAEAPAGSEERWRG